MRDIATATLSGNLTRDVELRELPSGAEVGRLRVATATRRRNGEEWVDKTNYFTVTDLGRYRYTLRGWIDRFGTWRRDTSVKIEDGQDSGKIFGVGCGHRTMSIRSKTASAPRCAAAR